VAGVNDFNKQIIDEFRANAGKVGGPFEGVPLVLLHTTGAKSGRERVNPVMYRPADGAYAVFGSKGGAPTNPDWYHNLLVHPEATIEVGAKTIPVRARIVTGDERDAIWIPHKTENPGFAHYEEKTSRLIPVILLEPIKR
jgi:deazaflavin-dependent oxidoreductase (nitroreductase family)